MATGKTKKGTTAASKAKASKGAKAKKAAPKKTAKAAPKKAAKKSAPKKAAADANKKKPAAVKSAKAAPKKKTAKASAKPVKKASAQKGSTVARPSRTPRGTKPAPAPIARIVAAKDRPVPRRTRSTTLPQDHEVLPTPELRGTPVDREIVIEAVKAALQAVEEHPMKGAPTVAPRSHSDPPQEGELDFTIAQEAQKAARELLAADDAAREEQRAVDERIAQVYASEAQSFDEDKDEDEDESPPSTTSHS